MSLYHCAGRQVAAVGEVVLAVGSSWGPDNLSEAQLKHVLAELKQQMLAQHTDVTVLRERPSAKPGTHAAQHAHCRL